MGIEAENSKQEIKEIVEKCIKCAVCKSLCPVFRIMRGEEYSPRGKAILLDNKEYEKVIYMCTLCRQCEKKCPLNLKLCTAFIKARQVMIDQKKEYQAAKDIIKNLNKTGNIYGIKEEK
ncbi:MAG: 4Fe-4S dicluster domain-containing protein [Candidatus Nanoarchaeia archaeon]